MGELDEHLKEAMLSHNSVKNSVEVARLRHPKTLVFPKSADREQRLHLASVQTITVAPVYKSMRIGAALLDAFCMSLPFIVLGIFGDGFFYAPMLFACAAIIFGSALAPILFVPFILNLLDFMGDLHPLMHMAFWLLVIMVALYLAAFESIIGTTPGKGMLGLTITHESGRRLYFMEAFLRNLLKGVAPATGYMAFFIPFGPYGSPLYDALSHAVVTYQHNGPKAEDKKK